jgi:Tfp pilus assembly protein PilF
MSKKLNLVDRLLAMGRKYQELGRDRDARHILGKLAGFGELPTNVAEETHFRLAEIQLNRRKFRRARRHLTAALGHQPNNARYHHLLAAALDHRRPEEAQRAAEHFKLSLEQEPDQPRCLSEYGLLLLLLERSEEGLEALRRAVDLAPGDPEIVGNLVEGCRREGLVDEARSVIRGALFRNPRDVRFQQLRSDFEFHQLRQQQLAALYRGRANLNGEDGPMLLPFVRPVLDGPSIEGGSKRIRRDGPSSPPAPHFPPRKRQEDQKRAQ